MNNTEGTTNLANEDILKTLLRVVWVMLLLTLIGPGIVMKGR
jgi:hypothetical protein